MPYAHSSLIKGRDVIGLKVITQKQGKQISQVEELVYDPHQSQVKALVVDEGGWFSEAKVLRFEDINAIGEDAVMIDSETQIKKASQISADINRIVDGEEFLDDTVLVTDKGDQIGQISDIYFDPQTGKVEEFEISQGLKNVTSGKKRVKVNDIVTVGRDATIVKDYVETDIETQAQRQGIRGLVNEGKQTVKSGFDTAQQKAPGLINQAKAGLMEAAYETQHVLKNTSQQVQTKARDISQDPHAQQMIEEAEDTAKTGFQKAKQTAQDTKDKVAQTAKRGKQRWRDQQEANAIGQYLTTNILNQDDKFIGKRGDLVTHQLIKQAEKAGAKDRLLSNLSPKPVSSTSSSSSKQSSDDTIDVNVTLEDDTNL